MPPALIRSTSDIAIRRRFPGAEGPPRRSVSARILVLGACIAGCGGEAKVSWPGPPAALLGGLSVSSMSESFVPFARCDRVPIVHGLQGGFHVWGSTRLRYMKPSHVTLDFTVTHAATAALVGTPVQTVVNLTPLDPAFLLVLLADAGAGPPSASCPDGGDPPSAPNPYVVEGTDGWAEALGSQVFLPIVIGDAGTPQPGIDGVAVTITLRATDADGRIAEDSRTLVPVYTE